MTSTDLVRSSRDGDQFHYHWAARQCLKLLHPGSGLGAGCQGDGGGAVARVLEPDRRQVQFGVHQGQSAGASGALKNASISCLSSASPRQIRDAASGDHEPWRVPLPGIVRISARFRVRNLCTKKAILRPFGLK